MNIELSKITVDYAAAFDSEHVDNLYEQKTFPFLSIVHPVTGYYEVALEGQPLTKVDNGCFIIPANTRHTLIHHPNHSMGIMHRKWAFLRLMYCGAFDLTQCLTPPLTLDEKHCAPLLSALDTLCLASADSPLSPIASFEHLSSAIQLMTELLRVCPFQWNHKQFDLLYPAFYAIEQNYANKITLSHLAECCRLSPSRFSSLFKKQTGKSPIAFLLDTRLSKAAALLLQSAAPLSEIAEQTGFYDPFHLSREFKKSYGISPRQYRLEHEI